MRKYGMQLKKQFWNLIFTGIEELEEGFYYENSECLGEMVIWGPKK